MEELLLEKLIKNWELYLYSNRMRSSEYERRNREILADYANKQKTDNKEA
jgi:hypothetical protein